MLHATARIAETLRNARTLLKPGGFLLLVEITGFEVLRTTFCFGGLPGWWLGAGEGRRLHPAMAAEAWHGALLETSFSGVDLVFHGLPDFRQHCMSFVMASQAVNDTVQRLKALQALIVTARNVLMAARIGSEYATDKDIDWEAETAYPNSILSVLETIPRRPRTPTNKNLQVLLTGAASVLGNAVLHALLKDAAVAGSTVSPKRFLHKLTEKLSQESDHGGNGFTVEVHRPCLFSGDRAPPSDALNGVLRYTRLMWTIPRFARVEGYVDIKHVDEIASDIALASINEGKGKASIRYRHHSSGRDVTLEEWPAYMKELYGEPFEVLDLPVWIARARGLGIHPLIATCLEGVGEKEMGLFPYLGEEAS
ncbi:hybrid NRPS/PKS enzyme [Apiospora marii]|uniref:hybrid NRPS/PKS enzyme n=1 Tax=Apiospora marii TaxID=335849 RepID=UPI00312D9477